MTDMRILQFRTALRLQLLYFRRSMYGVIMILPAVALFLLLLPGAFYRLSGNEMTHPAWQQLATLFQFLVWMFLTVISLLMGVVSISHEIRARSAKMILTRPVGFHVWTSSRYVAGLLIIAAGTLVNFTLLEGICWIVGAEPSLEHAAIILLILASNLALYSYAFFLSIWIPPVLAGFLAMIINGPAVKIAMQMTFGIRQILKEFYPDSPVGDALVAFGRATYVVFPDTFHSSFLFEFKDFFRNSGAGFLHDAGWSLLYSADIVIIFYLLSVALLRRKNLP